MEWTPQLLTKCRYSHCNSTFVFFFARPDLVHKNGNHSVPRERRSEEVGNLFTRSLEGP